jgi:prephenate dehydratase/chorismate mutase/prephenate dehydratase
MTIEEIRQQIDKLDQDLLQLIHRRMGLALRARRHKLAPNDPEREEIVLKNVSRMASTLLERDFLSGLFHTIMEQSKRIQERPLTLAAFQGELGAWGDLASRSLGTEVVPVPCPTFVDVFEEVEKKECDIGVVPIENSLEGAVTEVNDLLIDRRLHITAEVIVPIHHALMVVPGTDYRDIRTVYSHPQALGQCRGFLQRNKLEPRPYYDTAGAARWLTSERPTASAVLASPLAADLYGLEIIKESVEDHASNRTRFVIVSRTPGTSPGRKGTMVFSAPHRTGALHEVLQVFAEHGVNLSRIESRPDRSNPGAYSFLVDVLLPTPAADLGPVVHSVEALTGTARVLGMYEEKMT